ncbi:hypothetical protein JTB14_006430 [Gonioctena quinquepunctata]|nr:hypothetical protein JTB14_006430 [Gonioctena quinquepunctata]
MTKASECCVTSEISEPEYLSDKRRPKKKLNSSEEDSSSDLDIPVPKPRKGKYVLSGIRKWFHELKLYLQRAEASDILTDPSRIFNGDETCFAMCPKSGKVLAPKGYKNVHEIERGSEKETITVLLVFSADGKTLTPMVVFPFVRPNKAIVDSVPSEWFIGRSESGWMKSDTFFEYIANGLNK